MNFRKIVFLSYPSVHYNQKRSLNFCPYLVEFYNFCELLFPRIFWNVELRFVFLKPCVNSTLFGTLLIFWGEIMGVRKLLLLLLAWVHYLTVWITVFSEVKYKFVTFIILENFRIFFEILWLFFRIWIKSQNTIQFLVLLSSKIEQKSSVWSSYGEHPWPRRSTCHKQKFDC